MPGDNGTVPIPQIKINGNSWSITPLVDLRIVRGIGLASSAHLRIDESAGGLELFKIDALLDITIDMFGDAISVFSGTIKAIGIDHSVRRTECVVDAYDKSYKLGRSTVIKTHVDATAADIVTDIATQGGLTAEIGADLQKFRFDNIQQRGTPLRFLTSLCHAAGAEWHVEGSKLIVSARDTQPPTVVLEGDSSLLSFTARYSAVDEVSQVTTRGWDPVNKVEVVGTADWNAAKTASTAPIADRAADNSVKVTSWPRNVVVAETDASAAARAVIRRMGSAVLSARGECFVTPTMVPGRFITIEKMRPAWNGDYYVTEVEHVFGERQPLITRFTVGTLEPESLVDMTGAVDRSSASRFADGVTIGIVTNHQDDEGMNRVKLKLPYLSNDEQTGWARVVQPGAGSGRGWLTMPEVGDEVLVAFEHGDIRRPYVIGGLWNKKDLPPLDTSSSELRYQDKIASRSFTSRAGHRLTFLDEGTAGASVSITLGTKKVELKLSDDAILVSHKDGGEITIANDQASIVLDKNGGITLKGRKVDIEATGGKISVKGAEIDVKSDATTKVTAGATLELKATAPAKLESSAITEVKGQLVKIN